MGIKVTFTDTTTGKVISEDELTDVEVRALNTELENADFKNPVTGKVHTGIVGWMMNVIGQKSRQKVDEVVERSGKGSRFTPLARKLQIIKEVETEMPHLLKGAKEKMKEMEALK